MRTKAEFVPGQGIVRRPLRAPRRFRILLNQKQAEQLAKHAERRRTDADTMFGLIVKTILDEKLIDAILDDAG